jgi:uncharacterized protein YndB with AHSA1/START domain
LAVAGSQASRAGRRQAIPDRLRGFVKILRIGGISREGDKPSVWTPLIGVNGVAVSVWAMAHASATAVVNKPIAEVFAYLADGMNEPAWRPGVTDVSHEPDTGTGAGATYRQTMKGPGGRPIPGDYRITRYEPQTRLDFEVIAGPARPTGRFDLTEKAPASTEVTFTLDVTPRGLMILLTPLINRQVQTEANNIANLPRAMGG